MLERIAARRTGLDLLGEQLVKQLAEVRVERDELVVAERGVQRISEQGFGEYLSLAPPPGEARGGVRDFLDNLDSNPAAARCVCRRIGNAVNSWSRSFFSSCSTVYAARVRPRRR
ncbi:hypothetical protein Shyhy01_18570 [Streptomyces hygroscopicus subsp. hygroscopicus]|uniref:hypothetical protein n=1 Tax=Streptomyces sp. KHY 26 TaxID=3097359 RepID=UPI0024A4CF0B|nr:hypothetical protein [Streptomyces hygroscopicus]GLX48907.1 hypothetical protein Shyhy01_18570 [Streptomyces hygroscopicus subsp. hygroscopicus]